MLKGSSVVGNHYVRSKRSDKRRSRSLQFADLGPPGASGLRLAFRHARILRPASPRLRLSDGGCSESTAPIQAVAGPNGVVLDLGEGVWLVQAFATGYWCQGAEVSVSGQASSGVRLAFWPAASLQGQIAAPQGEPLPTALYVKLNALPAFAGQSAVAQPPLPTPQPGPARAVLICPIDQGKWSCLGPAGLFDVRLEAEGYAPRYDWGVSLKAAESTDLGPTELERTLSVFGRAVRKDGSAPPGPCRATLLPDAERPGGPDAIPDNAPPDEKPSPCPSTRRATFRLSA